MALTHDTRRALAERVQRKVEARGIPRHVIDDAVERVADALDRSASPSPRATSEGLASIVAAFSAPSSPDLGSRVRAALDAEGVAALAIGSATAGRHTVVTLRVASGARAALDRVAAKLSVSLSVIPDSLDGSPIT